MCNNFAETIPGTDKANFEFGINPDYNDYDDSVTFTINTETQTPTTYTP
jgi:hypothetical protein